LQRYFFASLHRTSFVTERRFVSHWNLSAVSVCDDGDGCDEVFPTQFEPIEILISRLPVPASRWPKSISMPAFRRNGAARRNRLDNARGVSGQPLDFLVSL